MLVRTESATVAPGGMSDVRGGPEQRDWYVGCWFTPSYAHWTGPLRASLDGFGATYHMLACAPRGNGWEAETMQKASAVARLMDAHPRQTLVLLDVDCIVRRDPQVLVDSVRGDIAAYVRSSRRGRAKDRARIKVMSGTMVFRPTEPARRFVDNWQAISRSCDPFDVDQTSLMIALATTYEFTFQPLPVEWCDFESAHPDPAIQHDNASLEARASSLQRNLARLQSTIAGVQRFLLPSRDRSRRGGNG